MASRKRSKDALVSDLKQWLKTGQKIALEITFEDFQQDNNAFHSANWCIVCVGEAAGQLLKNYPDFPSYELRKELLVANDTRNRVAHGYYDLSKEQVWNTIVTSFVKFSEMLEKHLNDLNHEH